MVKKKDTNFIMVGTQSIKDRESLDAELTECENMLWDVEMCGLRHKKGTVDEVDYLSNISDKLTLLIMLNFDILEELRGKGKTNLDVLKEKKIGK